MVLPTIAVKPKLGLEQPVVIRWKSHNEVAHDLSINKSVPERTLSLKKKKKTQKGYDTTVPVFRGGHPPKVSEEVIESTERPSDL